MAVLPRADTCARMMRRPTLPGFPMRAVGHIHVARLDGRPGMIWSCGISVGAIVDERLAPSHPGSDLHRSR